MNAILEAALSHLKGKYFLIKFEPDMAKKSDKPGDANEVVVMLEQLTKDRENLRISIEQLQDAMNYLKVVVKYQTFDLEATRRERDYYKGLCEKNNLN